MDDNTVRLDKYLANLGLCSRRNIKSLLKEQNLTVNGKRIRESGYRINLIKDVIRLNDKKIKKPTFVYYLFNKPKNVISTTSDEFYRKNVTSFIPTTERIYPVGRLDKDTTGLILLTNDGELTNLLTHPRYHVDKTYELKITGKIKKEQIKAFEKGIILNDGITTPANVIVKKETQSYSLLHVTIHEGKNRQIRRMCESVGINLIELKRITFGPLSLYGLPTGHFRELTGREVEELRKKERQNKFDE